MPTYTSQKAEIIQMPPAIPRNDTAERVALSCIVQHLSTLDLATWPDDLFFSPANKLILASAKACHESGAPSNALSIIAHMETCGTLASAGGAEGIVDVLTAYPTGDPKTALWYRDQLLTAARYRKAQDCATKAAIEFRTMEGDIAALSGELAEISAMVDRPRKTLKETMSEFIAEIESTEPVEAFSTRLASLDGITGGGPKRGELFVVAAETSGGKSIILQQVALDAAEKLKHVLVFSLEMPAKQVFGRMLSNFTGHRIKTAAQGLLSEDMRRMQQGIAHFSKMNLRIESDVTDWESIESAAREAAGKGQLDVLIVDYIQLVHLRALGKNETREQHVSEITRRLKALALQLNICVGTASQLNDEGRLRESRAISHHSDHVWILANGDKGKVLRIDKNRNGERDKAVPVVMHGHIARFEEGQ
jgi:replicative DNA helicase